MAEPTIYELESMRLGRGENNPFLNFQDKQAAFTLAQIARQQQVSEEAARTFRNQNFQREQLNTELSNRRTMAEGEQTFRKGESESDRAFRKTISDLEFNFRKAENEVDRKSRKKESKEDRDSRLKVAETTQKAYLDRLDLQDQNRIKQFWIEKTGMTPGKDESISDFVLRARAAGKAQAEKNLRATRSHVSNVESEVVQASLAAEQDLQNRREKAARDDAAAALNLPVTALNATNPTHAAQIQASRLSTADKVLASPSLVARVRNAEREAQASRALYDDAIRSARESGADFGELFGGSTGTPLEFGPQPAQSGTGAGGGRLSLPATPDGSPIPNAPSVATIPAEFKRTNSIRGLLPTVGGALSNLTGMSESAERDVLRPASAVGSNIGAYLFGGNLIPEDGAIYSPEEQAIRKNQALLRQGMAQQSLVPPEFYSPGGASQLPPSYNYGPPEFPIQQRAPVDALAPSVTVPPGYTRLPDGRMAPILPTRTSDVMNQNPFQPFWGPFLPNAPEPPMLDQWGRPMGVPPAQAPVNPFAYSLPAARPAVRATESLTPADANILRALEYLRNQPANYNPFAPAYRQGP